MRLLKGAGSWEFYLAFEIVFKLLKFITTDKLMQMSNDKIFNIILSCQHG